VSHPCLPFLAALALSLSACGKTTTGSVVVAKPAPVDTSPKTGRELYEHWCADCHDAGPGHPGTLRMEGDFGAARSVLVGASGVNEELVKFAVRNGFAMMPPFRATEIPDAQLELLALYVAGGER